MKSKNKCSSCSLPASYEGHVFTLKWVKGKNTKWRRANVKLCFSHYMENEFGLWPYACTAACLEARGKAAGVKYTDRDGISWHSLTLTLSRRNNILCSFCKRPLKWVEPKFFAEYDKKIQELRKARKVIQLDPKGRVAAHSAKETGKVKPRKQRKSRGKV